MFSNEKWNKINGTSCTYVNCTIMKDAGGITESSDELSNGEDDQERWSNRNQIYNHQCYKDDDYETVGELSNANNHHEEPARNVDRIYNYQRRRNDYNYEIVDELSNANNDDE